MSYQVLLLPSAERDLERLSGEAYRRCRTALLKLESNPRPPGCQKLVGEEGFRIRLGDYRVLYRIDDPSHRLYVYRVKHRREAYR